MYSAFPVFPRRSSAISINYVNKQSESRERERERPVTWPRVSSQTNTIAADFIDWLIVALTVKPERGGGGGGLKIRPNQPFLFTPTCSGREKEKQHIGQDIKRSVWVDSSFKMFDLSTIRCIAGEQTVNQPAEWQDFQTAVTRSSASGLDAAAV